jgi:hypothetical protein
MAGFLAVWRVVVYVSDSTAKYRQKAPGVWRKWGVRTCLDAVPALVTSAGADATRLAGPWATNDAIRRQPLGLFSRCQPVQPADLPVWFDQCVASIDRIGKRCRGTEKGRR